jgi:hypothetical protein
MVLLPFVNGYLEIKVDGFGNHKLRSSRPQLALQSRSAGDSCSCRNWPSSFAIVQARTPLSSGQP